MALNIALFPLKCMIECFQESWKNKLHHVWFEILEFLPNPINRPVTVSLTLVDLHDFVYGKLSL
jgi:hypothetical protein